MKSAAWLAAAWLLAAAPLAAQESRLAAEFRREGERIRENCGALDAKALSRCAITLATDHPLHVALGSIAPQNGFGAGPAFVMRHAPNESWRLRWTADAVGTAAGAWRAGAYMTLVHTPIAPVTLAASPDDLPAAPAGVRRYTVFTLYGQTIELPTLSFYGLGSTTSTGDETVFGMRETQVGGRATVPIGRGAAAVLRLSLKGEVEGRFVAIRAGEGDAPSIATRFTEADAPGLAAQPGFLRLAEGVRIEPALAGGHLVLDYGATFEQFVAPGDPRYSFRRWTLELDHRVPLYGRTAAPLTRDANTPNDCATSPGADACASTSRNRTGTVGFRLLASRSDVSAGSVVPFYFQHTLGGSDIDGARVLASYADYRFRAPHVLVAQASFEHSIGDWPIGVWLAADQGTVVRQREALGAARFVHSFMAGLTIRSGGFPAIVLSGAWGGREGRHFAATMSTSLLGGSSRPSLD